MAWAEYGAPIFRYSGNTGFDYAYSDGNPFPLGTSVANGTFPILINGLRGLATGYNGAATTGSMRLEWSGTANFITGTPRFGIPGGSQADWRDWQPSSEALVNGGQFRTVYDFDGRFYFARGGSGQVGDSQSPNILGGDGRLYIQVGYVQGPTPPVNARASANASVPGRIDIAWDAPASDGESPITGYRIYWSTNAGQIDAAGYMGFTDVGPASRSFAATGGTPGVAYYYRVAAKNRVTDLGGTTSNWSNRAGATPLGAPTVPLNFSGSTSTTQFGSVNLSWTAPSTAPGGITRYNIYRDGALFGNSTTTSFTATGLVNLQTNAWTVAARNAYTDGLGNTGPATSAISIKASGPPTAPLNFTAVPSLTQGGVVTLDWDPPSDTASGVTKYTVYYSSGTQLADVTSPTTAYTVTGLTPGTQYGFYVRAWNTLATTVGTPGPATTTVYAGALGEPNAPTNLIVTPSNSVIGRLTLSWTPPAGTLTGYAIHRGSATSTPIAIIAGTTTFVDDNLTPGTAVTYYVRARNAVTDSTNSVGGAAASASGTPRSTSSQAMTGTVTDTTNQIFNGSFRVSDMTSTTVSYAKISTNQSRLTVPPVADTVVNNTNNALEGTYPISIVDSTRIKYTVTGSILNSEPTPVSGGSVSNITNQRFSGKRILSGVNGPQKMILFPAPGADVTDRGTGGTVTNTTNKAFNGDGLVISSVTDDTISYDTTAAALTERAASGTVHNRTNTGVYNGIYQVTQVPAHNTFTYELAEAPSEGGVAWTNFAINPSMERAIQRIVVRTNLATNPQARALTNITFSSSGTTPTGTAITSGGPTSDISSFARATATTALSYMEVRMTGTNTNLVTPGKTYTSSAYVRVSMVGTVTPIIQWFDGSSNAIATTTGTAVSNADSLWSRYSVTGTAPASAVRARLTFRATAAFTTGETLDATGFMLEASPVALPYFDGSRSGSSVTGLFGQGAYGDGAYGVSGTVQADPDDPNFLPELSYEWAGAVNGSPSLMWANEVYGTKSSDEMDAAKAYRVDDWSGDRAFALALQTFGSVATDQWVELRNMFTLEESKTYTLMARFRTTAPITDKNQIRFEATFPGKLVGLPSGISGQAGVYEFRTTFNTIGAGGDVQTFRLFNSTTAPGTVLLMDRLMVVEGTYTGSYFDGNTPDTNAASYAWTGGIDSGPSVAFVFKQDGVINDPYGLATRAVSDASLRIKYRSGWAG